MFLSLVAVCTSRALPQESDAGRQAFVANCAECHGADGKGDGPRGSLLRTKPADLTRLAKKNHGVFDADAIYRIVDGRISRNRAHLSAEMPVWGCRHQSAPPPHRRLRKHQRYLPPPVVHTPDDDSAIETLLDLPCDPEEVIEARLHAIVDYVKSIQQR